MLIERKPKTCGNPLLICHINSPFMPLLGDPEYSPLLPPFGIPAHTSRARVILIPQPALLGRTACADVGEPSCASPSSSTPNKANNRGGDPAMGSRSIPQEQREEGRRADRHSGDREADAKQESKVDMPELREVAEPIQGTLHTSISLGRGEVCL